MSGWNLVLPPSRPDQLDLKRISEHAAGLDRSLPVGVLGSTTEFRDLLYELGFREVTVLERNVDHHARVSSDRVYGNDERLIEGDWLDTLPTLRSHFVLLLSDLTSGNVPWHLRRAFNRFICDALLPGGLFVDKILTNDDGLLSLSEIAERYASAPLNLQIANYFSCEAIFCSELQLVNELIDTTDVYERLDASLTSPRLAAIIKSAKLITPPGCLWYYGKPWSELKSDYGVGLDLTARHELTASQPYYRRAQQYVWRRP